MLEGVKGARFPRIWGRVFAGLGQGPIEVKGEAREGGGAAAGLACARPDSPTRSSA